MKLMNLFMVMLLLTGRAVLAETSSVTDRMAEAAGEPQRTAAPASG